MNRGADPSFLLLGWISPTGWADVSCRAAEPTAEDHIFTAECGKFRVCCWSGRRQHRRARRPNTRGDESRLCTAKQTSLLNVCTVMKLNTPVGIHECVRSWFYTACLSGCTKQSWCQTFLHLLNLFWHFSHKCAALSKSEALFFAAKLAAAMRRQTEEAWGNSVVKLRRKRKSSCLFMNLADTASINKAEL